MKKIVAAAIAMMTLSTAAAVTGTVAWFSANQLVNVNGMTVQTKVSSNLMIAEDNVNNPVDGQYRASLTQNVAKILEPASSVDGVAFYYAATNNVSGSGDAITDAYYSYASQPANPDSTNYIDHFSANYSISKTIATGMISGQQGAYAYADYAFYLKGTNVESTDQYIKLTKCNLLYNNAALDSADRAWRVAVFAQDATQNVNTTTALASSDKVTILTPASAANFTSGKAVNSASGLGDVTYGTAANVYEITAGETAYCKVTVRLWLEGEDNTCNNDTYAALTDAYSLDLSFELNTANSAVTQIGSVAA